MATLTADHLFTIRDEKQAEPLEEERALAFHHTVAELFMATMDRGYTGKFPARKSKKLCLVPCTQPKLGKRAAPKKPFLDTLPRQFYLSFIEHHVHQNRPLWERNLDDITASSWHWWCSGTGASFVCATALSKPRVCSSQQRKSTYRAPKPYVTMTNHQRK